MLFYQRNGGAHTLDEDQKIAALKILNVSRKRKGDIKVDGLINDPNNPNGVADKPLGAIEEKVE